MKNEIIDLQKTLNDRYNNLNVKRSENTWTNWDFIGVWDVYTIILLGRIENYLTDSLLEEGLNKDHAVIYGQLVRIFDLLRTVRRIILTNVGTQEVIMILNRSILETCVTLEYLLENYSEKLLDDYRMTSLRMLTAYEDIVKRNIESRNGETKPIESRILNSISESYKRSGIERSDINSWNSRQSILKGFKGRFESVDKLDMYDIVYKAGSQSVHGNWDSLIKNYLSYDSKKDRFNLNLEDKAVDYRLLNPMLCE